MHNVMQNDANAQKLYSWQRFWPNLGDAAKMLKSWFCLALAFQERLERLPEQARAYAVLQVRALRAVLWVHRRCWAESYPPEVTFRRHPDGLGNASGAVDSAAGDRVHDAAPSWPGGKAYTARTRSGHCCGEDLSGLSCQSKRAR